MATNKEIRALPVSGLRVEGRDLQTSGRKLTGYAATFNSPTTIADQFRVYRKAPRVQSHDIVFRLSVRQDNAFGRITRSAAGRLHPAVIGQGGRATLPVPTCVEVSQALVSPSCS